MVENVPPNGSLGAISPVRLYFLTAAGDRTGLLTVALADRTLQIHFRKGTPEFVDSNHPDDELATFLVRQKLLTFEMLAQAQAQSRASGAELLPTLFALGVLNPNSVFAQLAQRAVDLVYRALVAEQGTFTWQSLDLSAAKAMPMGHKWSILIEQLRRVPGSDARRRLMGALDLPVMKGQGAVAASELRLSPQEMRALTHFDGVRSLNQLATQLPADAEVMLRTAWVLQFCDVVSFAATVLKNSVPRQSRSTQTQPGPPPVLRPSAPTPNPAVAAIPAPTARPKSSPGTPPPKLAVSPSQVVSRPSRVAVGPSSGSQGVSRPSQVMVAAPPSLSPEAELKQLTETLRAMLGQNYFEILGVPKEAPSADFKVAYFKLAKQYHPDTVPAGTPETIAKLKADIFAKVSDAHRTLSDPKALTEYAAELAAGGTGEKVDISNILAAEEFFQKGLLYVKARKFTEAVKVLTDAINASDIEAEYYAWRGWAKFFLYPDKQEGQAEAMKDISICLKKNPNIAAVYYFQGFIAKAVGDMNTAKVNFSKTVQLDPRHIDAQRELRMLK